MDNTEAAEKFLKKSFQDNPAFSFNDWEIMYHHSVVVCSYALHLATRFPDADLEVVSVGALLHDIGKAMKTDEDTLRASHGKMAFEFSAKFLKSLDLDDDQYEALKNILKEESDSLENKIIKDADAIAFFADGKLQQALKDWADNKGLPNELQRKLDKFERLNFEESKKIAEPLVAKMKERWKI